MAQSSIEQLYLTYKQDVYRYLCSLTHNTAEAEDLLSETFLRALKRLPFFRGDCAARTWLFGIARNVWLESLRKRRPALDLDDLLDWYLEDRFASCWREHIDTFDPAIAEYPACDILILEFNERSLDTMLRILENFHPE